MFPCFLNFSLFFSFFFCHNSSTWSENYGDSTIEIGAGFVGAFQAITSDLKVCVL